MFTNLFLPVESAGVGRASRAALLGNILNTDVSYFSKLTRICSYASGRLHVSISFIEINISLPEVTNVLESHMFPS